MAGHINFISLYMENINHMATLDQSQRA